MSRELMYTLILACSFLLLFTVSEILYHFAKVEAEKTRKLVHVGTGLLTLLFPILLTNHWSVLLLCSSFLVILLLSLRFDLLKSINKIDRVSRGSLIYPFVVYILFLAFSSYDQLLFFYLPVVVLAVSDPLASLAGKCWPYGKYRLKNETKTLVGSTMFFASAFVISVLLIAGFTELQTSEIIMLSILVSIITALVEAVSYRGYDNLFIPMSALAILMMFQNLEILNLL
ncbi:hypothetical protein [Owenweeksia hongkongensis]|uniref:hypothetical protein n=1 Tax=Owenweeksia hongkongensis TaxID=253245 RepID=UPI003A8E0038